MSTDRESVTVLGLGAMGTALARTFLAAGHPVTVWNRTPDRADPLVADGAHRAADPGAAVAASALTVVCLLDDASVAAVLDPIDLAGVTVVNLTSTTPDEARATARRLTDRGVRYLDGAIMVPTSMVGTPSASVLYSGSGAVFAAHRSTLEALGGTAELLGDDPGRASLLDLGMLDVFFTGLASFLHAASLVRASGMTAAEFRPYAERIVAILPDSFARLAEGVDGGEHPGGEHNLTMESAALGHIVEESRARGVDPALVGLTHDLARRAVDRGHGRDGFSRVVDELRSTANDSPGSTAAASETPTSVGE